MIRKNVAEILRDHVTFELEAIDRMYLNAYVPSFADRRRLCLRREVAAGLAGCGKSPQPEVRSETREVRTRKRAGIRWTSHLLLLTSGCVFQQPARERRRPGTWLGSRWTCAFTSRTYMPSWTAVPVPSSSESSRPIALRGTFPLSEDGIGHSDRNRFEIIERSGSTRISRSLAPNSPRSTGAHEVGDSPKRWRATLGLCQCPRNQCASRFQLS